MLNFAKTKPKTSAPHAPAKAPPKRLRSTELGEQVNVRLQADLLAAVDARRTVGVSRADIIRSLIRASLTKA